MGRAGPRLTAVVAGLCTLCMVAASACGIAPIAQTPSQPPLITYDGPHGRPRAWGGGVCPVAGLHAHRYPPVPAAAFVDVAAAPATAPATAPSTAPSAAPSPGPVWHDTRRRQRFEGAHPWRGHTCEIAHPHEHALNADD